VEKPENVIVPDDVIPVKPVKAPPVDTSHDVVLMARVLEPPPMAMALVVEPVPISVVKFDEALIDELPPEIVRPPEKVEAVEVVAPRPVTDERVSASAVKYVEESSEPSPLMN
jgi:hypothetical protein